MEEEQDFLGTIEIGAIIPVELPPDTKLDITNAIIKLLNLKGVFTGLPTTDANMYVMNLVGICNSYNLPRVSQKAIKV